VKYLNTVKATYPHSLRGVLNGNFLKKMEEKRVQWNAQEKRQTHTLKNVNTPS